MASWKLSSGTENNKPYNLKYRVTYEFFVSLRLLEDGGSSITESIDSITALLIAAWNGHLAVVQYLLESGGASIGERNFDGDSALLLAADRGHYATVLWLLEHGNACITEVDTDGDTVWSLMREHFVDFDSEYRLPNEESDEDEEEKDRKREEQTASVTALLRVMLLRGDPPSDLLAELSSEHSMVFLDGARLRARLPAYIARRRALLAAHCLLIAPLRALVSGYEEPTTTEELWATGLGLSENMKRLRANEEPKDDALPPFRKLNRM
jgi:hypothetical protein